MKSRQANDVAACVKVEFGLSFLLKTLTNQRYQHARINVSSLAPADVDFLSQHVEVPYSFLLNESPPDVGCSVRVWIRTHHVSIFTRCC